MPEIVRSSLSPRVPALEGGRNFRDLGGYATRSNARVKWGRLYRSGSMAALTGTDQNHLATLGIRWVFDLRTSAERLAEPNRWAMTAGVEYWSRDYATSFGELRRVMATELPTVEAARAAMIEGYRQLPFEQAPAYRELFRRIRDGELPLIFNCSAGKDRAGTAAALILTALGVPRETVVADYMLSSELLSIAQFVPPGAEHKGSLLGRLSAEVVGSILGTHPSYIAAGLEAIEAKYRTIEAYFEAELAIDLPAIQGIREQLLE